MPYSIRVLVFSFTSFVLSLASLEYPLVTILLNRIVYILWLGIKLTYSLFFFFFKFLVNYVFRLKLKFLDPKQVQKFL